jgi:uncharacterized protein YndB with AHSA1/START domain
MTTLSTVDGYPVLRFERRLAHPAERVWTALTEPAELAHWFPATIEAELKVGAPVRFKFENTDIEPGTGEIIELEPPRIFAYRWGESTLRWELVPDGAGCRLLFTHTLGGGAPWGDVRSAARHAAGWDVCFDHLAAQLDGRPGGSGGAGWFERFEPYVEEFGLDTGEVRDAPGGFVVRFERDLVTSTGDAWAALVDGSDLAIGAAVPATATAVTAGPITALEPPNVLAFDWLHEGAVAGEVRWALDGPEMFARLVLTQTVPAHLGELRATLLAAWQSHLKQFVAALHGVKRS